MHESDFPPKKNNSEHRAAVKKKFLHGQWATKKFLQAKNLNHVSILDNFALHVFTFIIKKLVFILKSELVTTKW